MNVGNPLSKPFLSKIKEGTLSSLPKESAELALQLYSTISYWENNEKRIRYKKFFLDIKFSNKINLIIIDLKKHLK